MLTEGPPMNSAMYDCRRSSESQAMNRLCRQVSIESPGNSIKDYCVFNFEVPVPDVPPKGARIRVVCAGACYRIRNRSPSMSSISSTSSTQSTEEAVYPNPTHYGVRDGALFPGYEVAGVIDALGADVDPSVAGISEGQRVVLFPYDGIPHGYAEYVVVSDLSYIVPIPDSLPLGIAAMLPTGALLAKNTVNTALNFATELLRERPQEQACKILVVGTGGLALWAIRIAEHYLKTPQFKGRLNITIASLKDEGFKLAREIHGVDIVQWNEDLYEKQLIERTKDACKGLVDIVIDFGTTSRSLHRSLQCLNVRGVVLVCEEVAERLLPKFSRLANEKQQRIMAVPNGSIEQLRELVHFVSTGEIQPPPHTEFSADEASTVVQKLCYSEIPGRAILRFQDIQ